MKDSDYLGPDTPTMNLSRSEKKRIIYRLMKLRSTICQECILTLVGMGHDTFGLILSGRRKYSSLV